MMINSFLLPMIGTLLIIFSDILFFWLSVGILILLMVGFMLMNLSFVDVVFMSMGCMDMFSEGLILLSFWVSVMMIMSSYSIYKHKMNSHMFLFMVLVLCLTLVVTFLLSNLIMFYFFFEFSLIPTLFIIMGWGYQPERVQAGVYFLFYTLAASLPLLIGLCMLQFFYSVDVFNLWDSVFVYLPFKMLILFTFTFAFLVKLPMFFVHLWLPKAHVEAPVSGSMILAGVLLKLGGYGFYRVAPFCLGGLLEFGSYLFGLSVAGMFYVGVLCCRLNDMKALVAYSSVAHMGMVVSGLVSYYMWGISGSLMMMLAHGVSSSGLFCAVNMYYERSMSRSFFLNKGMLMCLPLFTMLFFMLCISNIAAPPTLNLASEIFLMGSILKFNVLMLLFFPIGSYMGAVFTLILFSYSQHGRGYVSLKSLDYSSLREFHLFVMHLIPINYVILSMDFYTCVV